MSWRSILMTASLRGWPSSPLTVPSMAVMAASETPAKRTNAPASPAALLEIMTDLQILFRISNTRGYYNRWRRGRLLQDGPQRQVHHHHQRRERRQDQERLFQPLGVVSRDGANHRRAHGQSDPAEHSDNSDRGRLGRAEHVAGDRQHGREDRRHGDARAEHRHPGHGGPG